MTLRGTLRILVSKWYVVVAGTLLSLILATVVSVLVPPQYTSTGVAVLVQSRLVGRLGANPLLNFDPSLSTTALVVVQAVDTPQVAAQLGVRSADESYTVEQASSDASFASGQVVQPFISVKTKAETAQRSEQLVEGVFDLARQALAGQQKELRVFPQNYIRLQVIGDASTPKRVWSTAIAATGAALVIGLCFTFGSALLLDRWARRRRASRRSTITGAAPRVPDPLDLFGSREFLVGADLDGTMIGKYEPPPRVQG